MKTNNPIQVTSIRDRARAIRSTWSPEERAARAREGQRRQQELLSMLGLWQEPEIWAVGAPMLEDSRRIAVA